MKAFLIDTVALKSYLEDLLPKKSDEVFKKAETGEVLLLVPQIVLGELLYIILRKKMVKTGIDSHAFAAETLQSLTSSPLFEFVDMDFFAWQHFLSLGIPELHDRMICATALAKKVEAVITSDEEIAKEVKTIW